jgi:RNA polymerase sigma factor (sigma-70 family)
MERPAPVVRPVVYAQPVDATAGFEAFFEAERPRLFRALLLITRNSHDAEEIMQEAFVKVWERWGRIRSMDDPTGYLYRTAMNGHRSALRRALRAAKRAVSPTPAEDPFIAVETRDEALRSLAKLTPRQRAAVIMTELLGFGFEESAVAMGIRPGTVRVLVSQARATLREARRADDG